MTPARRILPFLVLAGACGRAPREDPDPFRLLAFREAGSPAVLLNEVLLFSFSAPVDPASVTARSIAIAGEDGVAARGAFEVHRDRVEFHPAPVLARTLDDGGYRPGGAYAVRVAGFPRPDGIRAVDGRILGHSAAFSFRVADPGSGVNLFLDTSPLLGPVPLLPNPSSPFPVRLGDPIVVHFSESLRPDTVTEEGFSLVESRPGAGRVTIPVAVRLARGGEEEGARVEVEPTHPVLATPRSYILEIRGTVSDYGGNEVAHRFQLIEFRPRESDEPAEIFAEDFETTANLDLDDAGEDGWAAWRGNGTVSVVVPALAGDGRLGAWRPQGNVQLVAGEPARLNAEEGSVEVRVTDLAFAEVASGEGAHVEIVGAGPVLLRSASTLALGGSLRRTIGPGAARRPPAGEPPSSVGEVLDRLRETPGPDLVLVAAGNLRIEGDVVCDGTLVLAAGGRVVVEAGGRIDAARLLVASPGPALLRGGTTVAPETLLPAPGGDGWRPPRRLVFSCASRFLRLPGTDYVGPPVVVGRGNAAVELFGARALADRPDEPDRTTIVGPVADPDLLDGYPFLRFRVRFEVRPEAPEAAGFLDGLRFRFRRGSGGR